MTTAKKAYGKFSDVSGTDVRHVYDNSGKLLGIIRKISTGYRVYRTADGKTRDKQYLSDAFKTIRRVN